MIRLKNFDYSQNGAYFVTVCTQDKRHIFGKIVDEERTPVGQGLCSCRPAARCRLRPIGQIIEAEWYALAERYPHVAFDKFIVMPNHIHGIVLIKSGERHDGRQEQSPCPTRISLSDIMSAYKSITTERCNEMDERPGRKIWQFRYYDHIIRSEPDYLRVWQYIDENPAAWREDEYFSE